MPNPVVTVENLGKDYWLYPSMKRRLLGCFMDPRRLGAHAFCALSGLTFELYPGEAIAIIGKNGAGKSTALQVLAGITPATKGTFQINGRVCALLELGSGFNPEFSGRQNIALAGALLGLTHEQIRQEEENIITFADIGEFIDQPVKFYSSGMFVRLAFAVAVAGQPDLLIVDEALAVGDIFFRQKCYARLREMRAKGMAVILVTHSSGDAQEFCDRAILLEKGKQTYIGDPHEAMVKYYFSMQNMEFLSCVDASPKEDNIKESIASGHTSFPWPHLEKYFVDVQLGKQQRIPGAALLRFCITDDQERATTVFAQGSTIKIYSVYHIDSTVDIDMLATSATLTNDSGIVVYGKSTALHGLSGNPIAHALPVIYSCHEITLNIACGEYSISGSLNSVDSKVFMNKEYCGYEDWTKGTKRLVTTLGWAVININLPFHRMPSRVANFGLVDLPSKAELIISYNTVSES